MHGPMASPQIRLSKYDSRVKTDNSKIILINCAPLKHIWMAKMPEHNYMLYAIT